MKKLICAKDAFEAKYQMLINKRESTCLNELNDCKAFIEYSNDIDNIYKNSEEYNPNKKRKIMIIFIKMIPNMLSNKKLNPLVTELFVRGRKPNISLFLLYNLIFDVTKNIRLNSKYFSFMKVSNKREL